MKKCLYYELMNLINDRFVSFCDTGSTSYICESKYYRKWWRNFEK